MSAEDRNDDPVALRAQRDAALVALGNTILRLRRLEAAANRIVARGMTREEMREHLREALRDD